MAQPSLAVIISTYNSPDYLRRVLAAYALQTVYPDELLVADDGSTDETAQVIAEFTAQAPFPVRHVWHEDRGFRLAEIRNRAIAAASADYLVFSDGDCIPHPCFVQDHLRLARTGWFATGKRMLVGRELSPAFCWSGSLEAAKQCLHGSLSGGHHLLRLPWLVHERKGVMGLRGCNMAAYRSDMLAVNGYNEKIVGWGREDSELVARLFAYGLRRREAPFAAIVFHLWHPENSRTNLQENDRLLQEALASGSYRCACGIHKDECHDQTPG
ncbi:glycosyltransferase family 2 protein [Trichlorobacter ammonificans]|uniref:Two-domain glycosyltransferase n=1 Tax=Trichlorobacter ammonificans TaxID=2916410 RepID=A0ABM9D5H1_9BACT|nr:glycosyltransferase family 2 protein [Trichlorobacter ammonificans]CAH2030478.1 Putative two-domain glycosyltransferase [Trichlorobacter ammonificans]